MKEVNNYWVLRQKWDIYIMFSKAQGASEEEGGGVVGRTMEHCSGHDMAFAPLK